MIALTKLPSTDHRALVFHTRDTVPIVVPYYIDSEKDILKYITFKVLGKEIAGVKKVRVNTHALFARMNSLADSWMWT